MTEQSADPRVAILDGECDVEESGRPFGKRWAQQRITLSAEHLAALQSGKVLALDVQEEYVAFLVYETGAAAKPAD
jgi:hypothetical protein